MPGVLMLQGTGSDVGKSVLVAGLCRAAARRGIDVAPFKPQNMSNNAAACAEGGEIGRAQALQALAAGIEPCTDLNPVLLKPETDRAAQVVVHGRVLGSMGATDYFRDRPTLLPQVLESYGRLTARHELLIVEGAGSPAEVNLRPRDIANMGFARAVDAPVVLVGDIERGGVIASIVGTKTVLAPTDAACIRGFIVNKFRGDPALFDEGVTAIERRTNWPCYGVVPWLPCTARLPAEDAVPQDTKRIASDGRLRIVAPMLSRMANFDDADPLRQEPGVDFRFIPPGMALPVDADLVILFGTKSTLGDLAFLREQGWDHDVIAHVRRGGRVLGICGGYQMLGRTVADDSGCDGMPGRVEGLGLLDVESLISPGKTVRPVDAACADTGARVHGYEIHLGRTIGPDTARPMLFVEGRAEGARRADALVEGTYVHGLFAGDEFRAGFLAGLGGRSRLTDFSQAVENALDELAMALEEALDIDGLFALAGCRPAARSPILVSRETTREM